MLKEGEYTDKHSLLVQRAAHWLFRRGIADIEFEVRIPKLEAITNKGKASFKKSNYKIDIVGRDSSTKIAIECGGSRIKKLNDLLGLFNEVWVFPYGENEPFLWKEGMYICTSCGHTI